MTYFFIIYHYIVIKYTLYTMPKFPGHLLFNLAFGPSPPLIPHPPPPPPLKKFISKTCPHCGWGHSAYIDTPCVKCGCSPVPKWDVVSYLSDDNPDRYNYTVKGPSPPPKPLKRCH